jgi:tetratricopeptide (TPR) repeat protein
MLLEAQHAWLHGATADAERRYGALTTLYPNQLEGWFLLGDLLFHSNPYRGRSITEARGAFQRTLALDPDHLSALVQLARLAALEERLDELAALADRALTLSPSADQALGIRALRAFALGYTAEQQDLVTELHRAPGLTIARAFADVAVYTRNWDGAESLGRSLLPAARSEEFQAVGHIILAHLALARGRRAEAFDLLRHAGRHQPAWSLEIRGLFATLPFGPADAGEWAALERELREWDPSTAPPSASAPLAFHDGLHAHFRGYLLGLLRARQGDPNGVALEAEALAELPLPPGNEVLTEHLIRTLDAEALRLQGRPADALAALERLRTDVWFQLAVGSPFFAGTYQRFLRAELLAEAGRADEALGWWQTIAQRSPYELIFLAAAEQRMAKLLAGRGRTEQARRHEAAARSLLHSVPSERTT